MTSRGAAGGQGPQLGGCCNNLGWNGGGAEKWSDSECILKVKTSLGEDWLWSKRRREEMGITPHILASATGSLLTRTEMGKMLGGAGLGGGQGSV